MKCRPVHKTLTIVFCCVVSALSPHRLLSLSFPFPPPLPSLSPSSSLFFRLSAHPLAPIPFPLPYRSSNGLSCAFRLTSPTPTLPFVSLPILPVSFPLLPTACSSSVLPTFMLCVSLSATLLFPLSPLRLLCYTCAENPHIGARWKDGQTADLGHGRTGAIPHHHIVVLPRRARHHRGV